MASFTTQKQIMKKNGQKIRCIIDLTFKSTLTKDSVSNCKTKSYYKII
jgi:hypothetical protein